MILDSVQQSSLTPGAGATDTESPATHRATGRVGDRHRGRQASVQNRYAAAALLVLATIGCSASTDDELVELNDTELAMERRIDGNSSFWAEAPYLIEGPFACPLPEETTGLGLAQAHETLTIQNVGVTDSIEIVLEGRSLDSTLSAEPLLLVYAGEHVPNQRTAVANCLGVSKPGGGEPGSVTLSVAPGDFVTAIALEAEIGRGFDGSGSGVFRWRIRPL